MRIVIAFVLAVMCLVCVAEAQNKFKLNGKFSETDVAGACADANGEFFPSARGGGNYSCVKENCDGKGGYCGVECNQKKECTGTTPNLETGPRSNPLQILRPQLSRSPGAQAAADIGVDIDLPGPHYARFRVFGYKKCQAACKQAAGRKCQSWTYVRSNQNCLLRTTIPAPKRDQCCVSGRAR